MNSESSTPSVIDHLFENAGVAPIQPVQPSSTENAVRPKRKRRIARPLELPRDQLAVTFQKCRQAKGLSIADLAEVSGIDMAHIWRLEQGERPNTSRETLIVLSLAMVLDATTLDQVVEVANEILDAAGLKMLRTPWELKTESKGDRRRSGASPKR